jgi:hypothetical protein
MCVTSMGKCKLAFSKRAECEGFQESTNEKTWQVKKKNRDCRRWVAKEERSLGRKCQTRSTSEMTKSKGKGK